MNFAGTIKINCGGLCIMLGCCILLLLYMVTNNREKNSDIEKTIYSVNLKKLLISAIQAAEKGGEEVFKLQNDPSAETKIKGKTNEGVLEPATLADFNSHCAMIQTITQQFQNVKVISEEHKNDCSLKPKDYQNSQFNVDSRISDLADEEIDSRRVTVWIDPLDATKEFTENLPQYVTTMVCVAVDDKPVIGVIHKPLSTPKKTYWAWVSKSTSENLKINPKKEEKKTPVIIISMSHAGEIKELVKNKLGEKTEIITAAGSGYKSLEVAVGNVTAYLHSTNIKKWDICAGNAIINALNGKMTTLSNQDILYTESSGFVNTKGVMATLVDHEMLIRKLNN